MVRTKIYNTRQQKEILKCVKNHKEKYVTINQISDYLKDNDISIGLTTIYRQLNKLEKQGDVHRIMVDGIAGACFQYNPTNVVTDDNFYLKCEDCGRIRNMECSHLKNLYAHLQNEHHLNINPQKTIFYGKCEECTDIKHKSSL